MKVNNKYGFIVSYKTNKKKKRYLIINQLNGALWEIEHYSSKNNKNLPQNIIWYIDEIKTLKEYKKLWKNCPF